MVQSLDPSSSRYLIRVLSGSFHTRQIKHKRGYKLKWGPIRPKGQSRVRDPEVTLGARGFSCAVSGFESSEWPARKEVFLHKARPRRTTRGKPLVPRVSRGMLPLKFWNCRLPKMRFHAYWGKSVTENEVFKAIKWDEASSAVSPF